MQFVQVASGEYEDKQAHQNMGPDSVTRAILRIEENGTHSYQVCQVALCFPCDYCKSEN